MTTYARTDERDHVMLLVDELGARLGIPGCITRVWLEPDTDWLHVMTIGSGQQVPAGGYVEGRMLPARCRPDSADWQELLEAADDVLSDYGALSGTAASWSPSIRRLHTAVHAIDPSGATDG